MQAPHDTEPEWCPTHSGLLGLGVGVVSTGEGNVSLVAAAVSPALATGNPLGGPPSPRLIEDDPPGAACTRVLGLFRYRGLSQLSIVAARTPLEELVKRLQRNRRSLEHAVWTNSRTHTRTPRYRETKVCTALHKRGNVMYFAYAVHEIGRRGCVEAAIPEGTDFVLRTYSFSKSDYTNPGRTTQDD